MFTLIVCKPMFRILRSISLAKILVGLLMVVLALETASPTFAQKRKGTDWRAKRKSLDRELADELQDIANWSRESGIPQQVPQTFKIYQKRDLRRQYIYLPTMNKMPASRAGKLGQWLERVSTAKVQHAARIFDLAKDAAAQGANAAAFQLLHEVIYFDRDHSETRKILGHKDKGDSWQINTDRLKVKNKRPDHGLLKWRAGSYVTVITPHFTIDSTAGEEETIFLAESLEQWHDVWRQVFFEFWTSASVKRWIEKKGSFKEPKKRYNVVFFKDHQQYVNSLSQWVKGVEGSTGYYNQDLQLSFFSAGNDPQNIDTWKHELAHQLFRETSRSRKAPFKEQHLWLDEGIAMYFESITDMDGYVTLGGFDARRLQYARVRKMREGFFVPMAELASLSQEQFQRRKDISSIYSQAAGMAHMLMDDERGMMQPRINEFMKVIHKRKVKPDSFEKLIGKSMPQLDLQYLKFLETSNDKVSDYLLRPDLRTEMALPNADLAVSAFDSIGNCRRLRWLDVTGSKISAASIEALKDCGRLKQLFLTKCPIDPAAYAVMNRLRALEELDLTASSVTDRDLTTLARTTRLKVLRLTATGVTDAAMPSLARMQSLEMLDVSRTRVSSGAVARLKQARPNINITGR
jgi:hypothetical protein